MASGWIHSNIVGPAFVVVASLFGFLTVLFQQQFQKSFWLKDPGIGFFKTFLKDLNFGALSLQHEETTLGTPFPDPAVIPSRGKPHLM